MRVGVVGGGLAGLAAALELAEGGADVVLLEAGDRFGGQVRTTQERGFLVEEGTDGCHPDQVRLLGLLRDLRLDHDLIAPDPLPTLILEPEGLRETAPPPGPIPPATLAGGMASLIRALTRRLERRVDLRLGNAAVALTRTAPGWTVYPEIGAALVVDAVVLALTARPAAWLVHPVSARVARALSALDTRALVTVNVAYERAAVRHPLNASGFVVTRESADEGIEVCGFVSSVYRDRAPADYVLLRVVTRPQRGELIGTTDEGWAASVHATLGRALGLTAPPVASWVARWPDAIPVTDDPYVARVAEARASLRALGKIELAGAAYDGDGMDGALGSGRAAARHLLAT
jgi:oxygen-dependent protoporphyrinogen oxidase